MNWFKLFLLCSLALANSAWAWQPSRPVTVTVAYAPGSGNELLFRRAAAIVSREHRVNFVLEFKPGANEVVGTNHFAANAQNDGHSLFVPAIGVWIANPVWYKKTLTVDVMQFEPVINLGETPLALYTHVDNPVNNPAEFVAALKSGTNITVGTGAAAHVLAYQYIVDRVRDNNAQRIQYNSPASVAQAVASKEIAYGITPLSMALEWHRSQRVKILGVTSNSRALGWPGLDTSFPGLDLVGQVGIVAPAGTDVVAVEFWRRAFRQAVATPEYQTFLAEIAWQHTVTDYKRFIMDMRRRWVPVAEKLPFN
jgi:tripartite-type tricarboxylate transporter receptor subunit TctC